jgi:hypothetical protein
MWEQLLDLFRPKDAKKGKPEPKLEPKLEPNRSDYRLVNVGPGHVFVYRADVRHLPTGKKIGFVYGDTEADLVRRGKEAADLHRKQQSIHWNDINL